MRRSLTSLKGRHNELQENRGLRTVREITSGYSQNRSCCLRISGILKKRKNAPKKPRLAKGASPHTMRGDGPLKRLGWAPRGKGDYQMDCVPAPRITEADKTNDRKYMELDFKMLFPSSLYIHVWQRTSFLSRSLQRALDRRLYLLIYGNPYGAPSGKPVWHFPEKVYDSEETLRKCAESALTSVLGDLWHTYFDGNAPMGHMVIQPTENMPEPYKRLFFKSQVIDTNKFNIGKCEDFVWVTKDEVLEFSPEQAEFFKKMIIS
ncbi:putative DECOY [Corchorus olitorius]|uniref:Large ribosomal subunit protein mL46 n=1 Tax=Corchorus olitorius TaxID=93759 RepID=A0A1R3KIG8_9ROSI|nr:putative DECOY [Corchorus olitorius]